ncbi:hypothetical protein GIB67_023108 [Kingdonia uniflora]|uniref:RNase H type-1 domain-containing protein n=1 Tax=Kingdonia uniflora TaxID=39325 RepID=A0A7J7M5K6_9MAGN|nr:hypothetical protein GIB67_023108 [Kingdonia uniflora]
MSHTGEKLKDSDRNKQFCSRCNLEATWTRPQPVYCNWLAPPKGVVMLNTNGALTTGNLMSSITVYELQGVDNGLKVAIKNGYRKVIVGSDLKIVIQLLNKPPWDARAILQSILRSISQLKEFYISMYTGRLIG